jgi:hypothetical protein
VFLPAGWPESVSPGAWRRLLRTVSAQPALSFLQTISSAFARLAGFFLVLDMAPVFVPSRSYQIWNALQAFCSSLAGMIASRAVLEGAFFPARYLYPN